MKSNVIVQRENIFIDKKITPLKIGILTDIHVGPTKKSKLKMLEAIQLINLENPDIIFLLGDYLSDFYHYYPFLENLKSLKSKNGIFAVLGNHDYGLIRPSMKNKPERAVKIIEVLKKSNIKILTDKIEVIKIKNQFFSIVGVDDYWSDNFNLKILDKTSSEFPSILLSHNPDVVLDLKNNHFTDLIISGHTHGYSIRLPKIGAITTAGITKLGRKYDRGIKKYNDRLMYICSGVGSTARFLNPPQVSILSLMPSEKI